MFSSSILSCFQGVVGFRPSLDMDFPALDADLLVSESGLRIDEHPLINAENIHAIAPLFAKYKSIEYDPLFSYTPLRIVTFNGEKYVTNAISLGQQPDISSNWILFNNGGESLLISDWLRNLMNEATLSVFKDLYTHKKVNEKVKAVYENIRVYNGVGSLSDLEVNRGLAVGYEIELKPNEGLTLNIHSIGTQFNEAVPITIYVFHSSQLEAQQTEVVNKSKVSSFEWSDPGQPINLDYVTNETQSGGKYYIVYFQDDIGTARAVKKNDCFSCDSMSKRFKSQYSPFMNIRAVSISILNGRNLWLDKESVNHTPNTNWGLNFGMTLTCNLTDFICRNKASFDRLVQYSIIIRILKEMAFSQRINGLKDTVKIEAKQELDSKEFPKGAMGHFNQIFKASNFDLSKLNSSCLPCERRGITIGAK